MNDKATSLVSICKKMVEGGLEGCKIGWLKKKGVFVQRVGEKSSTPASSAGEYVCVVTDKGQEVVSPDVTVIVK